jgi:hypothetical protein
MQAPQTVNECNECSETLRRRRFLPLALGAILSASLGCSASADATGEGDTAAADGRLINGVSTLGHPEIGAYFNNYGEMCTATLVATRVVITAAHCVHYGSSTGPGDYGRFNVYLYFGPVGFTVRQFASLGTAPGRDDIAILQLESVVPLTPLPLAKSDPPIGSLTSLWGFGCTQRGSYDGTGEKRAMLSTWQGGAGTGSLCPGDSGGPVLDSSGQVIRVNSGYYPSNGSDLFADPVANFDRAILLVYVYSVT